MEQYSYFPSLIYREERPELVEYTLLEYTRYINYLDKDYLIENNSVVQTCNMVGDYKLKYLEDYFIDKSVDILSSQGYNVNLYNFFASGMWGQVIGKNGWHRPHIHKNSQICGLFFLEVPENSSYPMFSDPRLNKSMIELDVYPTSEITNSTSFISFNNLKPGTFLFYNSWLPHEFVANTSNESLKFIHFIMSHSEKGIQCSM